VKCGSGAFMKTMEKARSLAKRLVETTRAMGAQSTAFITDMNWPIGYAIGNAVEVMEAWDVLHGKKVPGTRELSLTLGAEMLRLAGVEKTTEAAMARVERALDGGAALPERASGLLAELLGSFEFEPSQRRRPRCCPARAPRPAWPFALSRRLPRRAARPCMVIRDIRPAVRR